MIRSFTRLYEATLNPAFLKSAELAATTLLRERWQNDGWMLHISENDHLSKDSRMRDLHIAEDLKLRPQVYFGEALLDLYKVTRKTEYLNKADQIAVTLLKRLQDPDLGGFYSSEPDGTEHISPPRKAVEWISADYMEYSIVSNEKTLQAQNLYVESLKSYNPRKILHYERPGRYPDKGQALLYICTPDRCSPPLANNDKIDFYVNEFK